MKVEIFSLALLLALASFWASTTEETIEPSPPLTDDFLPVPPFQGKPWSCPDGGFNASVISAAQTLFRQGLADPRGCEYRVIHVGREYRTRGDVDGSKTHGWVLPGGHMKMQFFAVCWNGLVYPVRRIGQKADLHGDIHCLITHDEAKRKDWIKKFPELNFWRSIRAQSEWETISHQAFMPMKALLLLRIGEVKLALQLWKAWSVGSSLSQGEVGDDSYLVLATDWLWDLYDRAQHAHMRGDDRLALHDARRLDKLWLPIEEEAEKRGFTVPSWRNKKQGESAFFHFLHSLPRLLADQERRREFPTRRVDYWRIFEGITDDADKVDVLILAMDQGTGQGGTLGGGLGLKNDILIGHFAHIGDEAVEPLLRCIETDTRLTREVLQSWRARNGRHVVGVHEVAFSALEHILKTSFQGENFSYEGLHSGDAEWRASTSKRIREIWKEYRDFPIEEKWYLILADDSKSPYLWIEAASWIVMPSGADMFGGCPNSLNFTTQGWGRPGDPIPVKGEVLRRKRDPTVSRLMALRLVELWPGEAGFLKAGNSPDILYHSMAKSLAYWDPPAASHVLRKETRRCMECLAASKVSSHDLFGALTTLVCEFIGLRAAAGDSAALTEYAKWLLGLKPPEGFKQWGPIFELLWRHGEHPAIKKASDFIFNNTASHWNPIYRPGAGSVKKCDYRFIRSAIVKVAAFREQAIRMLCDHGVAGHVHVRAHDHINVCIESGCGLNSGTIPSDPLCPPLHTTPKFRVCDLWAWLLSSHEGAPWIELFWPEKERDRAVAQCAVFLERFGHNYQLSEEVCEDCDPFRDEPLRLTFPRMNRPATRKDERDGKAIFSLEGRGDTHLVSLPRMPIRAVWKTLEDNPHLSQRSWLRPGERPGRVIYSREGWVWQAEEVKEAGRLKRYFGFVGQYRAEAVPGEEIEFPSPRGWARWSEGLDARIEAPGPKEEDGMVFFLFARLGEPIPVSLHLRNRTSNELSIPTSFYRRNSAGGLALLKGVEIELFYSETWDAGICVKSTEIARKDAGWTLVPGLALPHYEGESPLKPLGAAHSRSVLYVDINHLFRIEKTKGWYKIRISKKEDESNAGCGGPVELEICITDRK